VEGARPAAPADLAVLRDLARAAVAELAAQRGGPELLAETGDPVGRLEAALSDPDSHLVAGTVDAVPVGVALARASGEVGRVELAYVDPEARGVGVGAAMLDELRRWLAGRGCRSLDAVALPGNRAAKQFFEGAGMVARLIVMRAAVDG